MGGDQAEGWNAAMACLAFSVRRLMSASSSLTASGDSWGDALGTWKFAHLY